MKFEKLKMIAYLLTTVFLIYILVSFSMDQGKLHRCSNQIIGEIVSKSYSIKRPSTVKYSYSVNNEIFYSSDPAPKFMNWDELVIGKEILIEVACSDPSVSRIIE